MPIGSDFLYSWKHYLLTFNPPYFTLYIDSKRTRSVNYSGYKWQGPERRYFEICPHNFCHGIQIKAFSVWDKLVFRDSESSTLHSTNFISDPALLVFWPLYVPDAANRIFEAKYQFVIDLDNFPRTHQFEINYLTSHNANGGPFSYFGPCPLGTGAVSGICKTPTEP